MDYYLRELYDNNSPRVFAVLDPIHINIINENEKNDCIHPKHPKNSLLGSHITSHNSNIIIEKNDFREYDSTDYFRLAPNKIVRLKYSYFIKYIKHDNNNVFVEKIIPENQKKIKGIIHWLSIEYSIPAIFELYSNLLIKDNYNLNSKIIKHGYVEKIVLDNLSLVYQLKD